MEQAEHGFHRQAHPDGIGVGVSDLHEQARAVVQCHHCHPQGKVHRGGGQVIDGVREDLAGAGQRHLDHAVYGSAAHAHPLPGEAGLLAGLATTAVENG